MRDKATNDRAVPTEPCSLIALDMIRGLAALVVFLDHVRGSGFVAFADLPTAQQTPIVAVLFALTRLGREAVLIFFVLSGFLVGGQLISRVRQHNFDVRRYAIDRMTRILVPLAPICLFTAAINCTVFHKPLSLAQLIGNMTGLNGVLVATLANIAPLWSLAFEIWFYVLGGAAAYLVSRKGGWGKIAGLVALIVGAGVFNVLGPTMLLFWVLGALSATYLDARGKEIMGVAGLVSLVGGVVLSQLAIGTVASAPAMLTPAWAPDLLICGGFCLSLPFLCSEPVNAAVAIFRKPAAGLAACSYSLYLAHVPVDTLCQIWLPKAAALSAATVGQFLLRCTACVAFTVIFFFLFERNTIALRRFLGSKVLRPRRSGRDRVVSAE